jgi:hypothetical protein
MQRAIRLVALAATLSSLIACGSSTVPTPNPTPTPTPTPTLPPALIAGSYDLTITAASICSANLPVATRTLTYTANITQTGTLNTLFIITLSGSNVTFGQVIISGGIIGQELKFGAFQFSDQTTGGGISLVANANGIIVAANGAITGTLSGTLQTPTGASCTSSVHQLALVKK